MIFMCSNFVLMSFVTAHPMEVTEAEEYIPKNAPPSEMRKCKFLHLNNLSQYIFSLLFPDLSFFLVSSLSGTSDILTGGMRTMSIQMSPPASRPCMPPPPPPPPPPPTTTPPQYE